MSQIESKLKQLKVVDLKDILQKASVPLPTKTNKADLISKILTTPAAVELFNRQNSTNGPTPSKPSAPPPPPPPSGIDNDLLDPPEQFDWESTTAATPSKPEGPTTVKQATATTTAPAPTTKPTSVKPSAPTTAASASTTPAPSTQPKGAGEAAGDESEKRKKRAERFGVPLVEPKQKPTPAAKPSQTSSEDVAKLDARASRFGIPVNKSTQKRPAPVDQEEEEKRRKRAERFGSVGMKTKS